MMRFLFALGMLISMPIKAQLTGFVLTGDPESSNGATWTYKRTINGTVYDLRGVLFKPPGSRVFSSVLVNHGTGGNVNPNGYADRVCKEMVKWGYVCIAVNYTHSGQGAPCGSPGLCDTTNWGASNDNFLRAMKCWDILASLGYTDTNCIAAFGHSRGAFLTTGLLGTFPGKFSCAGHTAGGVGHPTDISFPTTAMVNSITRPYILHHGTNDNIVSIIYDNNIESLFRTNGVTYQYFTYAEYNHNTISQDSLMFSRTKTFFNKHICSVPNGSNNNPLDSPRISIYPNPSSSFIKANLKVTFELQILNMEGQLILSRIVMPDDRIDISILPNGVYICRIKVDQEMTYQKLSVSR